MLMTEALDSSPSSVSLSQLSACPGDLLEMPNPRPHPRPAQSDTLGRGPSGVRVAQPPRGFPWLWKYGDQGWRGVTGSRCLQAGGA